jgi:hypothetical protein
MPPFESDKRFSSEAFFVKPLSSKLLRLGIGTLRPTIGTEVERHGAVFEDEVPIFCVVVLTDSDASELTALKLLPPILLIITMGVDV